MESVRKETYWLWQVKSKSSWWGTWRTSRGGRGSTVLCSNLPGKAPWTPPPPIFTRDRGRAVEALRLSELFTHLRLSLGWGESASPKSSKPVEQTDLMVPRHFDIFFFKLAFRVRGGAVCCHVRSVPTVRKTKVQCPLTGTQQFLQIYKPTCKEK